MKYLLTGATGNLGSRVMQDLIKMVGAESLTQRFIHPLKQLT